MDTSLNCDLTIQYFDNSTNNLKKSLNCGISTINLQFPDSSYKPTNPLSVTFSTSYDEKEYDVNPKTCNMITKFMNEGKITMKIFVAKENINFLISKTVPYSLNIFVNSYCNYYYGMKENIPPVKNNYIKKLLLDSNDLDKVSSIKVNKGHIKAIVSLEDFKLKKPLTSAPVLNAKRSITNIASTPPRINNNATLTLKQSSSPDLKKSNKLDFGSQLVQNSVAGLSIEQTEVLKACLEGANIFFSGAAGTGKSYLLNKIINLMERKYHPTEVFVTASTGVAAVNVNGITLHNFSGFGGKADANVVDIYNYAIVNRLAFNQWSKAKVLIIDEISMVDGLLFDKLNQFGKMYRGNKLPFGGIQLILCGDFFQLPPIGKEQTRKFCFEVPSWKESMQRSIELTQVYRQTDTEFIEILNSLRWGNCSRDTTMILMSKSGSLLKDTNIEPTSLLTHKADVERLNNEKLENLPGSKVVLLASDTGKPELIKQLGITCPAKSRLELKLGAMVVLLKNLSVFDKLCNGSIGKVVAFKEPNNFPIVKFNNGKEKLIEPDVWMLKLNGEIARRVQIPLDLGWNFSIHRSQGMSLDYVEMSLNKVFEYGQAYVALSRARSLEGLRFMNDEFDSKVVRAHPKVINFYKSLNRPTSDDFKDI